MTLREINEAVLNLVDQETGEILDVEAFQELQMAREEKAENMALWVLELASEADQMDAEIKRLKARKEAAERKIESLKQYLPCVLNGEKLKTPLVSVGYRRSQSVAIDDNQELIRWAETSGHDDVLRYREPEISKTAVKMLLQDGITIPHAQIVENISTVIR